MTQDSAPLHGELAESENHKHRIEPMHNSRTKRKRRDSGEKFFWGELVSSLVLDDTNSIHDLSLSELLLPSTSVAANLARDNIQTADAATGLRSQS
jgi:hypothetical protein